MSGMHGVRGWVDEEKRTGAARLGDVALLSSEKMTGDLGYAIGY